jgi:hypothetical protein
MGADRKPTRREAPGRAAYGGPQEEDEEEPRAYDKNLNSKSFMPLGMLALRPANARVSGGADTILARMMREAAQAVDKAILESRPRLGRVGEPQLKEIFVSECLGELPRSRHPGGAELRANLSSSLAAKLRESAKQISRDKAEFHLLNLQGILFPGNKTQLR